MFSNLHKYLAVFFTGFAVTYLLTPLVRALMLRWGVVDHPDARRPHKQATPRGGGIAVVLGVHAACLVALTLPWAQYVRELNFDWWRHFAGASLVIVVLGVIDDVRGLKPWIKLLGQAAAASLMFASGTRVGSLLGWELPWALDFALTLFWLVGAINAFNLIDGLDGLASGLAIMSALGLCGVFVLTRVPGDALVLLGLIGACLAFLRYNFHPASIFLGDSGSMFLGFILGAVSLQTLSAGSFILSLTIPLFVLGVPIFDTLLAIWRRSARLVLFRREPNGDANNGHGVMHADLEHLHHRLLKTGLNARRVATLLWIANGFLVGTGLLLTSLQSHAVGIFLVALVAGLYVLLRHVAVIELRDTGRVVLAGFKRPTRRALLGLVYPLWDVAWIGGALAVALRIVPATGGYTWEKWLLSLPVWVAPTFSLLAVFRLYHVVWSRAQTADALRLVATLWLGLVVSVTIAVLIEPTSLTPTLLQAVVMAALSHPALLGARLIYRCAEDLVPWLRGRASASANGERVVLYGAGGRCQLFLKERHFPDSRSFDSRVIVGLIDDAPSLNGRLVYGFKVLGGRADLPRLIHEQRLDGVVITASLTPESLLAVQELARRSGVHLTEWCFEERELDTKPALSKERVA